MSVKTIGNLPIMHIGDVEKATSKPRQTIYRESREGTFPKPIQLGKRRLAWLEVHCRVGSLESTGLALPPVFWITPPPLRGQLRMMR